MKKPSIAEAKKIVSDVLPEKSFWVNNGPVLKNLHELAAALKKLKPQQFTHHVNKERNDFAKWIEDVFGDRILAQRVRALKTKESAARAVLQRISALKGILK